MSYKKVGGLRFIKVGRFGLSFWVSRRAVAQVKGDAV
jgi:hypothetical protein